MEGPKFEDTKRSAVICQACTEFSSRHEKLNFKCVSAGLFVFLKSLSFYVASCLLVSILVFLLKTLRLL